MSGYCSEQKNALPHSAFIDQVNRLLSYKQPKPADTPAAAPQTTEGDNISETDPGVIEFFLELIHDLFDTLIEKNSHIEGARSLLLGACQEIKFFSLIPIIQSIQENELGFVLPLFSKLIQTKNTYKNNFINTSNMSSFVKHIISPIKTLSEQRNAPEILTSIITPLQNEIENISALPNVVRYVRQEMSADNILGLSDVVQAELVKAPEAKTQTLGAPAAQETPQPVQAASPAEKPAAENTATLKELSPVPIDVEKSIRVSGSTLESFMDNIGEIVLNNTRLNHFLTDKNYKELLSQIQFMMKNKKNFGEELFEKIRNLIDQIDAKNESLNDSIHSLNSSLSTLHDTALDLRVVPMELIYRRLPRTVKLLASELKKEVLLHLEGQDVQIDKIMVDTLSDPIIHILRNAIDHGIESPEDRVLKGKNRSGKITIKTEQQGSRVQLQIMDDGQGINREKIIDKILKLGLLSQAEIANLTDDRIMSYIFHPGFSTAASVSNISGRGVGMDIVRMNVMQLGGTVGISSEPGKGTTFTIKVPITAAIQDVLIVSAAGQKIAIPNSYVNEVLQIAHEDIMTLKNNPACILREQYLPMINLGYALGYTDKKIGADSHHTVVVVSQIDSMVGIEVDRILEKTQVYMKEVDSSITSIFGIGGATIRGNGEVMIILDCEDIFESLK